MRRIALVTCLVLCVVLAVLAVGLTGCSKGAFVGSSISDKYHTPECLWAKEIDRDRQVWWDTAEAAEADGYVPCTECMPDGPPAAEK